MTKPLFILIQDSGDGSYCLRCTFNLEWICKKQEEYDQGDLDYDFPGVDGDGFNYKILNVPIECTLKSLGISYDIAEDCDND